jgi:phage head maturation protease
VEVLNAVYEADFLGFSYGFRVRRDKPAWRRRWKSSTLKG